MKRFALVCLFLFAADAALAAEPALRSSTRLPAATMPAAVAPAAPAKSGINPALVTDLSGVTKYDPAKDVGKLLKAVAELQAEVAELKASNAALAAQIKEVDTAADKQFIVNLGQAKQLDALTDKTAELDGLTGKIAELKSNLAALSVTFAAHTHVVADNVLIYTNREVVTNSHATGDEYTTIGSVTGSKSVARISSTPSTQESWVDPNASTK